MRQVALPPDAAMPVGAVDKAGERDSGLFTCLFMYSWLPRNS